MNENIVEERNDESISLSELFNIFRKNILILILVTLITLGIGGFYTWYVVTPMYTSTVDIQISNVNESVATVVQIKNNVKEIVKYEDIISVVVDELNIPTTNKKATSKQIAKRVSSADIGSASAVRVSYQDKDQEMATKIVIAIAQETIRRVNIPKEEIGESLAFSEETLVLLNEPVVDPNQKPSSPNKMLNLSVSILLGLVLGAVIVIMKEQFSSYFKSKKEIEKFTNYSVIAVIPALKEGKKNEKRS